MHIVCMFCVLLWAAVPRFLMPFDCRDFVIHLFPATLLCMPSFFSFFFNSCVMSLIHFCAVLVLNMLFFVTRAKCDLFSVTLFWMTRVALRNVRCHFLNDASCTLWLLCGLPFWMMWVVHCDSSWCKLFCLTSVWCIYIVLFDSVVPSLTSLWSCWDPNTRKVQNNPIY